jgi:hypothetical protein
VQFVIVLAIVVLVVLVVSAPLRRTPARRPASAGGLAGASQLAELEAAREAKYREIRDADLDHRTGKLSDADFEALDQELRAEAIAILQALDRAADSDERLRSRQT